MARFLARQAYAHKNCEADLLCGGEFSLFDFASVVARLRGKGKWAKLVIAKTGLSNPKCAVERKKLKTVSVSVEVVKCREFNKENAVLVLPLFLCPSNGRITYNVLRAIFRRAFRSIHCLNAQMFI